MPRPSRFDEDDVLDAALRAICRRGSDATIGQVAGELGGPVGSIYHRFGSREEIVARLWVRSIRRFHAALLPVLEGDDSHAALVAGARFVCSYCDEHPDEAIGLHLSGQERLLRAPDLPPELRDDIRTINDGLEERTRALTTRRYGRASARAVGRVHLATRVLPYGLVRPWLGRPVPADVVEAAGAGADAILRLGDR